MISDERIKEIEYGIGNIDYRGHYRYYTKELLAERKQLVAIAAAGDKLRILKSPKTYQNFKKTYKAWRGDNDP